MQRSLTRMNTLPADEISIRQGVRNNPRSASQIRFFVSLGLHDLRAKHRAHLSNVRIEVFPIAAVPDREVGLFTQGDEIGGVRGEFWENGNRQHVMHL